MDDARNAKAPRGMGQAPLPDGLWSEWVHPSFMTRRILAPPGMHVKDARHRRSPRP
jgi:hypothetical protein